MGREVGNKRYQRAGRYNCPMARLAYTNYSVRIGDEVIGGLKGDPTLQVISLTKKQILVGTQSLFTWLPRLEL